jgi:hypothetical protein
MGPTDAKCTRRERLLARAIVASLVVLLLYGLAHTWHACILMWRATRGTAYEPTALRWMLRCHGSPIERDLAAGRIRPGDSVEELVARRPPERMETYGPYQVLCYFPPLSFGGGPVVWAKDGRVAGALSSDCTWHLEFFDTLTEAEHKEAYGIREAERAKRWAHVGPIRIAIIGGIGVMEPWQLNPADGQ